MCKRKKILDVILDFKSVHGDKYDYSLIKDYKNNNQKLPIICRKHGIFYLSYKKHFLRKQGCNQCNGGVKLTKEFYIKKAKEIHGNKYDYSKVEYINSKTKVCIICPIHGEFFITFSNHCNKSKPQGCPFCKSSKLEKKVRDILSDNNIKFNEQKKFNWLGKQSLDFYLPKYNIAIECQGEQHFKSRENSIFNEDVVSLIKKRDINKLQLCNDNNINLIYYSELNIEYPYNVITNKDDLLKTIFNNGI